MHYSKILSILFSTVFILFLCQSTAADDDTSDHPDASDVETLTTLTDNPQSAKTSESKSEFSKDTKVIYYVVKSNEIQDGQKVKTVWIAEDTNGAAPENFQIDKTELVVHKDEKTKLMMHFLGGYWNIQFELSKPTKGWPLGKYRVDFYIDGKLAESAEFSIK